jgi:hypothetical protein
MGLFGGLGKKLKDGRLLSGLQAAQATLHGDYAGAASIYANQAQRQQKTKEAQAAAEQLRQVYAAIDSDPSLSPLDRQYAKANPDAYIKVRMERFRPLDSGPGGGSRGLPGPNGEITNWQTAPRFDNDGNIYGPGTGTTLPPLLQRGTKAVPVQPGGEVRIHDSISGRPVAVDGSVIGLPGAPQAPPPVLTDEDIMRLDQGGAGSPAPRTFPRF